MDSVPALGVTGHFLVGLGQVGALDDLEVVAPVVHAVRIAILKHGVVGRSDTLPRLGMPDHLLSGDRVMQLVEQLSAGTFDEKIVDEQLPPRSHRVDRLGLV